MAKLPASLLSRKNTALPPLPIPRVNTHSRTSALAEMDDEVIDDTYTSPLAMGDVDEEIDDTHFPTMPAPRLTPNTKTLPTGGGKIERPTIDESGTPIEYTPITGKRKRAKAQRVHRITEQDQAILMAADWLGRATCAHLAFAVENTPKNVAPRLLTLERRGYLHASTAETMKVYGITKKGLDMIGSPEKPMADPSRSTVSHRNKLNSTVIHFKIGGDTFSELLHRDSLDALKQAETARRVVEEYNGMLKRDQDRIRQIPEMQRTKQEHSILNRQPRSIPSLPEVIEPKAKGSKYGEPQVALAERIILRDSALTGELACQREWLHECDEFMKIEGFPTRRVGVDESRPVSQHERAFMESAVEGNSWIFKHWNPDGRFDKKHTPDGALVLPHRIHADGTVSPGSYWIELEDQRKKLPEVIRACEQAMDAPNIRGLIYLTDNPAIANLVKRAKREIIEKLMMHDNRQASIDQKQADAKAKVDDAILLLKTVSLNKHKNGTGFWG